MTDIAVDDVPTLVTRYLTAHSSGHIDEALALFASDATVIDNEETYVGADEIRSWLTRTSTAFTYTVTSTRAEQIDADNLVVMEHLEGDFPGAMIDQPYRFTLGDDVIARLVIGPPTT